ncbi:MAG TPA: hypothetical protein VMZ52_09545 [Bryobacteraceae bacterium]|nr:hypothetical protein [Bryobacteraceae bacterium]
MIYEPYFSVPLLALIALTALFASDRLIQLTAVLCVFPVASVLDLTFGEGLYSIPPCLLVALLLLPCALAHGHSWGQSGRLEMIVRMYLPLIGFTVFAVLTSVFVPLLFEGMYQAALSMDTSGIVPLEWGRMNVTQSVYLVVLVVFAILVSCELTGRRDAVRHAVNAFILCGYLAALIAAYQLVSDRFGWYFPVKMLYSRPEARSLELTVRQFQVGGLTIRQISGSFSEPSTLAQFMLGAVFGAGYWWLRGGAPRRVKGLAIVSLATLLATVSSTAYVGLALSGVLLLTYLAMSGRLRGAVVAFVVIAALAAAMLWAVGEQELAGFRTLAGNVLDLVLFAKRDSISFHVRWLVDSVALDGFVGTYGLGLGWGSTRGSSLLIHLLGNTGVIGIFFLTWFAWNIRRRLRGGVPPVTGFTVAALCGNLLGGALSVPDINSVTLWLLVGLAVAASLTPAAAPASALRRRLTLPKAMTTVGAAPARYRFLHPITHSEQQ